MNNKIAINDSINLDLQILRKTKLLVQANSGGRNSAELADLEATSGTFGTYLSRLRSNGLIEVNGEGIRASENLFI